VTSKKYYKSGNLKLKEMDKAMKFLAILIPSIIALGSVLEYFNVEKANIVTGIGVIGLVFVLMPFFLFWRYDSKKKKQG
jgi:hypothetical protein